MNRVAQGGGSVTEPAPGYYVLHITSDGSAYTNAQLDDYHHLPRGAYPWRAPVTLTLSARVSGDVRGTWGFGWWNAPYSPLTGQRVTWPATAWFFGSGSGDLRWAPQSAATGFKAATLETRRRRSWLAAVLVGLWWPLLQWPRCAAGLWPFLARQAQLSECMLPTDDLWHQYALEWQHDALVWSVDGVVVHTCAHAPAQPMGLCIWIDNQALTATPSRWPRWGLVAGTATLEVRDIRCKDEG